ncbi:BPI fold-containing family B member 4-like [Anolis sagrei]|uniref:BPI fold-containing family B member 4-like n=1 Tax=Anolis sagrei TaxID=38937 RepID=UPI00351FA1ED
MPLCPIVVNVYDEVNLAWLNYVNVDFPLGAYGKLTYQLAALPVITSEYIGIDVSVAFQYEESSIIVSPPVTDVPIAVPPLDNYVFCLAISPPAINILLYAIAPKVPLEVSNSPAVFSKAEELKDGLLALVPSGVLPDLATSDLSLEITIGTSPTIAFSTTGATVTLIADIEILGKRADGSKVSVVAVRCNVSLKATIDFVDDKVILSLSLSKNVLGLIFSGVDITDVSSLLSPINELVNEIVLPVFNGEL